MSFVPKPARSPAFLRNRFLAAVVLAAGSLGIHGINGRNHLLITSEEAERYANPDGYGARYGGQEFVRHKILDAMGTLALSGRQFRGTGFEFRMTGHEHTLAALKYLFDEGLFSESIEF